MCCSSKGPDSVFNILTKGRSGRLVNQRSAVEQAQRSQSFSELKVPGNQKKLKTNEGLTLLKCSEFGILGAMQNQPRTLNEGGLFIRYEFQHSGLQKGSTVKRIYSKQRKPWGVTEDRLSENAQEGGNLQEYLGDSSSRTRAGLTLGNDDCLAH